MPDIDELAREVRLECDMRDEDPFCDEELTAKFRALLDDRDRLIAERDEAFKRGVVASEMIRIETETRRAAEAERDALAAELAEIKAWHYMPRAERDALSAKLAEAERERDEARANLERLRDPLLKSFRFEDGKFDMAVTGPIVQHMAAIFVAHFKAMGTENYLELSFFERDEPYHRYTVTVQKVSGAKSAHELRAEAESRLSVLTADNAGLREELRIAREAFNHVSDGIIACERGSQIYEVLANYRAIRRGLQDARTALAQAGKEPSDD